MQLVIKVTMDNSAFEDNPQEINRILCLVSRQIQAGKTEANILDSNGNNVGKYSIS